MKMKQIGFSLTELLISMVLGAFLLAGLYTVYLGNKKTYETEENLARMQENGRLALQFLNRDVRMAGYMGCLRSTMANRLIIWHTSEDIDPSLVDIKIPAVPNTDILFIQSLDSNTSSIQSITDNTLILQGSNDFKEGDKLLLSNCEEANEVTVIYTLKQKLILNIAPKNYLPETTEIGHLQKIIYYIGKTKRKDHAGKSILALYRFDLNGPANQSKELIEGVENMQLILEKNILKVSLLINNK